MQKIENDEMIKAIASVAPYLAVIMFSSVALERHPLLDRWRRAI
jgi:hypothetical protein